MPSLTLVPAATIAGELAAGGVREDADSGRPAMHIHGVMTESSANVGVWECEPGGWPVVERSGTEFCYVVSGSAVITAADTGRRHDLGAGDTLVLPPGWSGRWDVTRRMRLVYVVF
ncbi:hypothetical protein EV188_104506 [Actinomycetospora succinea]|uniref:(S)-ureidoglycine aminohydrolase cupin domain-containing protein n=1 Tax=Actinomycetospora succinea TaxID=663603 RepID=A0A4R6VJQ9_9PSEU|nr:cupin domain-containing protein [Actinomycetospora succinea]TDQ58759.1 hypothetical protein EV188_104506 [Actinomycetospora succinea]